MEVDKVIAQHTTSNLMARGALEGKGGLAREIDLDLRKGGTFRDANALHVKVGMKIGRGPKVEVKLDY